MDKVLASGCAKLPLPSNFSLHLDMQFTMGSPIIVFARSTNTWLHDAGAPQGRIALTAIVFGLFMCACGSMIWKFVFAFVVAALGVCFVLYEEESLPLMTSGPDGNLVLAGQTGLTLFLAVFLGFEGSQILLGSCVGLLVALATEGVTLSFQENIPYVKFVWSCVWAALGMIIFHDHCRQTMLASVAPILGALLFASGAGTVAAQSGVFKALSPDIVWLDAASALLGSAGSSHLAVMCVIGVVSAAVFGLSKNEKVAVGIMGFGLFVGALASATGLGCSLVGKCPPWLTPPEQWTWPLLGGLTWMLAAVLGALIQLQQLKTDEDREEKRKNKKKKTRKGTGGDKDSDDDDDAEKSRETQPFLEPGTQPQLQTSHRDVSYSSHNDDHGGGTSPGSRRGRH